MKRVRCLMIVALVTLIPATASADDWPQWRGPQRTGVAESSTGLANAWPEEGPKKLWESETIPSRDDGGLGSLVAADKRAYIFVAWHRSVPIEQRTITDRVLRSLGWTPKKLPAELSAKVEAARKAMNPRLLRSSRGKEWIEQWTKTNLSEEQLKRYQGTVERRLRDGPQGFSLELLEQLAAVKNKTFADPRKLDEFLDTLSMSDFLRKKVIAEVPTVRKSSDDVILCLDMATGKTLWKKAYPGKADGRKSSSTPCISEGRIYALGTTAAYCHDAKDGKLIWKTPINNSGIASSFVIADGIAVTLADSLTAFDTQTGKILWTQQEIRGRNSSPLIWKQGDAHYVICNSSKKLVVCAELKTGKIVWTAPGGGDSSCVVSGNHLVVASKSQESALIAYQIFPQGAKKLWSHPLPGQRVAATPIIHDNNVYMIGSETHLCVGLTTGKVAWQERAKTDVNSALIADGKLYALDGKANYLIMLDASPAQYKTLGKTRIKALWCPSPALAGHQLLLRMGDKVTCYDLSASSNIIKTESDKDDGN